MKMLLDHLKGMPSVAESWVTALVGHMHEYVHDFLEWLIRPKVKEKQKEKKDTWMFYVGSPMQVMERAMSRKGNLTEIANDSPTFIRFVLRFALTIVFVVRVLLLIGVGALWVIHGPDVLVRVSSSVVNAELPNKKRTPKKSRPWQRLDDFRDVRARIRELSYPKQ